MRKRRNRGHWSRRRGADDGFTLTELLVVTIILGILAGIAFTVFLVQRNKAYKAGAVSSLRNTLTVATSVYKTEGVDGYPDDLDIYRGELSNYTFVAGNEAVTGENAVSLVVPADHVVALASRGGPYCYYARQENGGRDVFHERRSFGGSVACQADEFTSGSGTGW